jgi:diguanylate cyclase (GGDEF)-like protein/PAS domain S-box-containing protein
MVRRRGARDGARHGAEVAPTGELGTAAPAWSDEELLRAVVASSPLAIYVVNSAGVVELWNPAAEELFGWTAAEAVGRRLPFVDAEADEEFERLRSRVMAGEPFSGLEAVRRRKDGRQVSLSISTVPLRDESGAVRAVLGVSQDVTDRKHAEAALVRQAQLDSLTGLHTRGFFLQILEQTLARPRCRSALVLVDLDDFKDVNDSFGHHVGDELLAAFAARLRGAVGPKDVVGRLGGDEFVILLEGVGPKSAEEAPQRVFEALSGSVVIGGRELTVRVSGGVALCRPGNRVEEVLRRADVAMYAAKRGQRGSVRVFDEAMERDVMERVALEARLSRAVEGGELRVHYQPIFQLATGKVTAVEALVRWQHPEHGHLLPNRFIPLAEASGAIVGIGRWVLLEACAQLRVWQREHPRATALRISVNLSPRQLRAPGLESDVLGALEAAELKPEQLQLEVTESALAAEGAENVLRRLGELGIRLAIDDFGTGYSSLTALRRFPFGALKIDRSFIAGLETGWEDRAIVLATLGLSRSLGLTAIAEGVETAAQLETLSTIGCEEAQGYLLGRPQPAAGISRLLGESTPWLPKVRASAIVHRPTIRGFQRRSTS